MPINSDSQPNSYGHFKHTAYWTHQWVVMWKPYTWDCAYVHGCPVLAGGLELTLTKAGASRSEMAFKRTAHSCTLYRLGCNQKGTPDLQLRNNNTRHELILPVTSASTPQPGHHRWEIPTVFVGKPEGKGPLRRRMKNARIILKCILKKRDRRTCSGLMWLRIETSGGLLWKQQWTVGFHKMRGIWLADQLLASQ